ncbi:MAG: class I SAM-dependent methyltransferase [Candidatus Syntropharchaeia archaeon]
MKLKEILKGKLKEEELKLLRRYDVIGDIAIVSILPEIEEKKYLIAEAIVENAPVNVVLRKKGHFSGIYRIPDYEILVGDRTETIYRENGCIFKLDPTKVFFSPKMNVERRRLMEKCRNGEEILCGFAGIGAIPVILTRHLDVVVSAVEINEAAFEYMCQNLMLNKVEKKVKPFFGDIRKFEGKFDRVIMTPPIHTDYLDLTLDFLKPGGTVHYYTLSGREGTEIDFKNVEILEIRRCGKFAPGVYRVCVEFRA